MPSLAPPHAASLFVKPNDFRDEDAIGSTGFSLFTLCDANQARLRSMSDRSPVVSERQHRNSGGQAGCRLSETWVFRELTADRDPSQ